VNIKSLKALKTYQKDIHFQGHIPHLIVGSDINAVILLNDLINREGSEKVRILSETTIDLASIFGSGPSLIRGEDNFEFLNNFARFKLENKVLETAQFYKDQKFRSFGGKANSISLQPGEEFFTYPAFKFCSQSVYQENFKLNLERPEDYHLHYHIQKLEQRDADLGGWKVECSDGSQISCEHLYFSRPLWKLTELLSGKEKISEKIMEFCQKSRGQYGLMVQFKVNQNICSESHTFFIPQSLTYDWGHFIGSFNEYCKETNIQNFSFFCHLNEDETSAEMITRKIKLMKRVLKRVFENLNSASMEEKYLIIDQVPVQDFDDSVYESFQKELPQLFVVGMNAPLNKDFFKSNQASISFEKVCGEVRSLASLEQVLH